VFGSFKYKLPSYIDVLNLRFRGVLGAERPREFSALLGIGPHHPTTGGLLALASIGGEE
jgi:hypothetical protein